jgi:uncharacterized protein
VRRVFADTFYWIALSDLGDDWHKRALKISRTLIGVQLVTTDSVLIEYVNFFSRHQAALRRAVVEAVHDILNDENIEVVPQTRLSLLSGMALHAGRPDKNYSLTDCISMQVMRELGIFEVLTHDEHFQQEGFVLLLR